MKKIKIFLLDDHKIVRDGLKSILAIDSAFQVIGEESSPELFLKTFTDFKIDILILDITLPGMSGLEVLKKVKKKNPNLKILILSMHDSPEYVIQSLKDGANAYLSKSVQADEFLKALYDVYNTGVYYPSQMNLNSNELLPKTDTTSSGNILTPKEKEVLSLMAKGLSSKQIAKNFGLSSRTVEAHRLNIMKKISTNNSAETIAVALKLKLI
jgi:two-component system, NarL family, nitrate/nitrite response regulator NarL